MMLSEEKWESLCNRCGKCCYLWLKDGSARSCIEACGLLDKETNRCIAYEDRHTEKAKMYEDMRTCVRLKEQDLEVYYLTNFLPKDCAYIKYYLIKQYLKYKE